MSVLISLLAFAVAIGVLVTVHEWGHFQAARSLGVRVLRFSIGFGRPLRAWRSADGTEFVVRRVLTATAPWVSLEVVEDEDDPYRASLLFVPYEHVRRVVFRPAADRPEQLGFRRHEPCNLDPAPG